jgi:hypothetical protein
VLKSPLTAVMQIVQGGLMGMAGFLPVRVAAGDIELLFAPADRRRRLCSAYP